MSEPVLLALETSAAVGSVALTVGGTLTEREIAVPREQTESVLQHIDELLAGAALAAGDLDAVAFGQGPGSFTGLRVAAAVAQGLGFSTGVPLVPVSSLAGLAQAVLSVNASRAELALCLVDARMGEVYSGLYRLENGLAVAVGAEQIGPPEAVHCPDKPFVLAGNGAEVHPEALAALTAAAVARSEQSMPRARDLLPLAAARAAAGSTVALQAALPVYLRQADAWRKRC